MARQNKMAEGIAQILGVSFLVVRKAHCGLYKEITAAVKPVRGLVWG